MRVSIPSPALLCALGVCLLGAVTTGCDGADGVVAREVLAARKVTDPAKAGGLRSQACRMGDTGLKAAQRVAGTLKAGERAGAARVFLTQAMICARRRAGSPSTSALVDWGEADGLARTIARLYDGEPDEAMRARLLEELRLNRQDFRLRDATIAALIAGPRAEVLTVRDLPAAPELMVRQRQNKRGKLDPGVVQAARESWCAHLAPALAADPAPKLKPEALQLARLDAIALTCAPYTKTLALKALAEADAAYTKAYDAARARHAANPALAPEVVAWRAQFDAFNATTTTTDAPEDSPKNAKKAPDKQASSPAIATVDALMRSWRARPEETLPILKAYLDSAGEAAPSCGTLDVLVRLSLQRPEHVDLYKKHGEALGLRKLLLDARSRCPWTVIAAPVDLQKWLNADAELQALTDILKAERARRP